MWIGTFFDETAGIMSLMQAEREKIEADKQLEAAIKSGVSPVGGTEYMEPDTGSFDVEVETDAA